MSTAPGGNLEDDAVGTESQEPMSVGERLDRLELAVGELADRVADAEQEDEHGPWRFEDLALEEKAEVWKRLGDFVAYLDQRFLSELTKYAIPGCWYLHPVAVELLLGLMLSHDSAHKGAKPRAGSGVSAWHLDSLYPTLERLRPVLDKCVEANTHRTSSLVSESWVPDSAYMEYVTEHVSEAER